MALVRFEKVVAEGKALGRVDGKALFVLGPLPGEEAEVEVTHEKKSWAEGVVREYREMSPHRHKAHEAHYLSCSPWQSVDYDYQLELKRGILAELFGRPGLELAVRELVAAPEALGYRNKLEFALQADDNGRISLAMHGRGTRELVAAPDGCVLGSDDMNAVALKLASGLTDLALGQAARSLVVRRSVATGRMIAVVQVATKLSRDWADLMMPELHGLAVVRAVKPGVFETVWSRGVLELTERVADMDVAYSWESFFQVNPPVFELALQRLLSWVKPGSKVLDLYGGVGTIGLAAARVAGEVVGAEVVPVSSAYADRNAMDNGLDNFTAEEVASEKLDPALLKDTDTVIVDPPRAGLQPRVVDYLLRERPRQILYLSCNPATQVRDIMALQSDYVAEPVTAYDFYPGTPHVETLVRLVARD